jgi:hypothetical protein
MSRILALKESSEPIARRFESALAKHGGQAVRSFDLKSARAASTREASCPYHHTTDCTCQYLILIVYTAQATRPCTVVLHEFEGMTRVTLDDPEGVLAGLFLEHPRR